MQRLHSLFRRAVPIALAAILAPALMAPALQASTFIRASVETLTAQNSTVVLGEVVNAESYWNRDVNFILTDVRLQVTEVVKGAVDGDEVVITLMGGTVGDLSILIPGGAELQPYQSYLIFLGESDLPGAPGVQTVPAHCQGVFEIVDVDGVPKAISQASSEPLLVDNAGISRAPGGDEGLPLDTLIQQIRSFGPGTEEEDR